MSQNVIWELGSCGSLVVLGLCGLKKLRIEGRPMGSRERSKKYDPLETSSFFLLVKARI
jgi:hypothetical protein